MAHLCAKEALSLESLSLDFYIVLGFLNNVVSSELNLSEK